MGFLPFLFHEIYFIILIMNDDISSLLSYPFDKGQLATLDFNAKTLFWGGKYSQHIERFSNAECLQTLKTDAVSWSTHDIKVRSQLSIDTIYQNIFCVLPKQKEAARYMLAQSFHHLEDQGLLLAVAANDAGGKKIESWMKELGARPTSLSKSKCRIVWAHKDGSVDKLKVDLFIQQGDPQIININNHKFMSQPGVFGWNKIDQGSKILVENLPVNLTGIGADFGCGYGYLSYKVLKKYSEITKLYALDVDYNALSCAKRNLTQYQDNVEYRWTDLTQTQDLKNLDWIVMNPPFHDGKKTQNDVGQNFIVHAAASLKKDGVLYMVANAHLPYEKSLNRLFSKTQKIYEEGGYKVFVSQK